MAAYRKRLVLPESGKLLLNDLPFAPGSMVEVSVIEDLLPKTELGRAWGELFAATDAEPGIQRLNEEEIAQEIAKRRAGR